MTTRSICCPERSLDYDPTLRRWRRPAPSHRRQKRLWRFLAAGQRRLDRAHIRAGVKRLAGKEYGAEVQPFQEPLRIAGLGRRIGIGAAREWIVAPVDRAPRDELSSQPLHRQLEYLGERIEAHRDEVGLAERGHA